MAHLLYPDEEDLPTFFFLWADYRKEETETLIHKQLYKHGLLPDLQDPSVAEKGKSWNHLVKGYEQQFCTEPRIAAHYFSEQRVAWLLTDPEQGSNEDPPFIKEFSTLKEVASHLVTIGLFEEETLFPDRIVNRIALRANIQPSSINHRQQDSPDNGNGAHTEQSLKEKPNLPDPALTDADQAANNPPAPNAASTPIDSPPQTKMESGAYPLDLLLRMRQSYRTNTNEDLNSFRTALHLTRTHPRENVYKTAHHVLFRRFDPSHPQATLKAVYYPKLHWSIEIQARNRSPLPIPSTLTGIPHLQTLLANWRLFKDHLPLYQWLISPTEYPASSGFLLINEAEDLKRPPKLLTLASARALNQLLDPHSAAQKTLIKACRDRCEQIHADSPDPQHQADAAKLAAYAYALSLTIETNPQDEQPHNRAEKQEAPPLATQEAITLLSINATEIVPPASPAQQLLYHRITAALRNGSPLNDQQRQAIARYFPLSCRNREFLNWTIKIAGILPPDLQTRLNLITVACENADSRLLTSVFQLARDAGADIKFTRADLAKFSRWILHKAYPDQQRANRCLNQLPLPVSTRLSVNSELRKPGWQNKPVKPITI